MKTQHRSWQKVTLNPADATGQALVITNGATQTSQELVKITGEAGQTALNVATGNTNLSGTTTVSTITDSTATLNSGAFTGLTKAEIETSDVAGQALKVHTDHTNITGNLVEFSTTNASDVALAVTVGNTSFSGTTTVSTLTDGTASQTAGAFTGCKSFAVDPNAAAGGALTITNSATQNSAELVKITGTAGQTALNVATGNTSLAGQTTVSTLTDGTASQTAGAFTGCKSFAVDPNAAAGGALTITNSATQNSAELVKITGTAGQTALNVATGNTSLAGQTTVSTLTDGTASQTAGAFTGCKSFAVDPNAAAGGALTITNSATQNSAELVKITGTAGQTALSVPQGTTSLHTATIDPNAAAGGALTITNSATQNSAELVKITGTAGQTALNVATGNTSLAGQTTVSTLTDGTASQTAGAFTGCKSFVVDPNDATGEALVITNSTAQTSGELVRITGTAAQTALQITAGNMEAPEYIATSDRRLKQDIKYTQPVDALRQVMQMRAATYAFRDAPMCPDKA